MSATAVIIFNIILRKHARCLKQGQLLKRTDLHKVCSQIVITHLHLMKEIRFHAEVSLFILWSAALTFSQMSRD